jgi:hypothetical protein
VGSYKLRITSVTFGSSAFAPSDMAESDTVLTVEVEVVSGDPQVVAQSEGEFDVWITDAAGTKSSARATTSTGTGDSDILAVQWLFGVPQSSRQLYLNFPSGVKVDLTPLLP